MRYSIPLFISLIVTIALTSCGSNTKEDRSQNLFSLDEKKFVHRLFQTEYLWYDKVVENINYASFTHPQALIDALKVTPPDRWSFSMTSQQYENFANQKTAGFGFGYRQDFTIYLVRIDSPSYNKLRRGDKITHINGEVVTHDAITQAASNLGKETIFTIIRNNKSINIAVIPREYTFKVSSSKIIEQNQTSIGYLRYDSFTGSSVEEFEKIFKEFQQNNISELVIDLRYNGGGSIAVASALLDNITNQYPGQRQGYLDWNDKYKEKNENFYFEDLDDQDGNELAMQRVFFLVSKNSASASEIIISALSSYLGEDNVITIGTATHGKPVGMRGRVYQNNYYFLVNFIVKNNTAQTTPYTGIQPTCQVEDNLTFERGETNEPMLKTALSYIKTGSCP